MKSIFIIFLCAFLSLSVFGQSEQNEKLAETTVAEINLARDNGEGKAGEITGKFLTTDTPIYCLIQLNSTEPTTVKMILVAVKADGLRPETKSISVSYTTKKNENGVTFNASPDGDWAAGNYRIDVFINNKFSKSATFEITKSPTQAKNEKLPAPEAFAPRRKIFKPRKN